MGRTYSLGYAATVASAFLISPALAQTTETECRANGDRINCTSRTNKPLDYGAILKQGEDLVPKYQRNSRPIDPPKMGERTVNDRMPTVPFIRTGREFINACDADLGSGDKIQCYAFLDGITSSVPGAVSYSGGRMPYCLPEALLVGDVYKLVTSTLRRSPEILHYDAAPLIVVTLHKAYPCVAETGTNPPPAK